MECYMCNKEAVSVEHVPPRCLFPEQKDLPLGVDLRKQLITVPACEDHNGAKSQDDEYLLHVLVLNLPANEVAQNQFLTKIMRSIKKNPRLMNNMMQNPKPVVAVDERTGDAQNTVAIQVDGKRVDKALESVSRALYCYHFKKKWMSGVRTFPEFMLFSLDPIRARDKNEPLERMTAGSNQIFEKSPYFGQNPDVFQYQVVEGNERIPILMRLHFYNGCKVTVFFTGNE